MQSLNSQVLKKNVILANEHLRKIVTKVEEKAPEQYLGTHDEAEKLAKLARNITLKAEKEREDIIKDALQSAESIQEKARQDGYVKGKEQGHESGFLAGMKQAEIEAEKMKRSIEEERQNARTEIEYWQQDAKRQMINFGIRFAEQLVHQQINQDESILAKMIHDSVETLELISERVTVKVHPDNVETLQTYFADSQIFSKQSTLQVLPDQQLEKFDYIIDTENQKIVFDLKNVLEKLKKALLEAERVSA